MNIRAVLLILDGNSERIAQWEVKQVFLDFSYSKFRMLSDKCNKAISKLPPILSTKKKWGNFDEKHINY